MNTPRSLSIQDFTYELPETRIASFPLKERDASKLMVYTSGIIEEDYYRNIANHIPEESLLVFNNTKVIEARLVFQKSTGGVIEIFCLEPHEQYADITTAMMQKQKVYWQCLVGGASKWKSGQILEKYIYTGDEPIKLQATYIEKRDSCFIIELSWSNDSLSFAEMLHIAGAIPLPPYLKRKADKEDYVRYQTVYARHNGSVAAPTAGLHFTDNVFTSLAEKRINTEFVTLHVGAGTFKPVKAEKMEEHEMHAEWIDINQSVIERLINHLDKGIVAVGTTSLRTLESLYWIGVKILSQGNEKQNKYYSIKNTEITQWEVYELKEQKLNAYTALSGLLHWMKENRMERLVTKTQILIAPGYTFRIVNGLVTNFHQPQSTLLLLVAAMIGNDWKKIYNHALENEYRFLSYGDGSLLWNRKS